MLKKSLRKKYPVYEVFKNRLLETYYPRWCGGFKAGNDHGRSHIERVLRNVEQLLGKNPLNHATKHEIYLTLLSVLFHDVGVIQDRKDHGELSAKILELKEQQLPELSEVERKIICASVISHSSSKSIADECQSLSKEEPIDGDTVRPHFVAALVRLADELDEDYSRAPVHLEQVSNIPEQSQFYWRFCQRISGIKIAQARSEIEIHVAFKPEDAKEVMIAAEDDERTSFVLRAVKKLIKIKEEEKKCNLFLPDSLKYKPLKIIFKPPSDSYATWQTPRTVVLDDGINELKLLKECAELLRTELVFWTSTAIQSRVDHVHLVLQAIRSLSDLSVDEIKLVDEALKVSESHKNQNTIAPTVAAEKKKSASRCLAKFLPSQLIEILIKISPYDLENKLYRDAKNKPVNAIAAAEFEGTTEKYLESLIPHYDGDELETFLSELSEIALVEDAWSRIKDSSITEEQCLEEFYNTVRSRGELPDAKLSLSGILSVLENLAGRWPRKDSILPLSQFMLRLSRLLEVGSLKDKIEGFAHEHYPNDYGSTIVIADFLRRLQQEDHIDFLIVCVDSLGTKPSYMRAWLWRRGTESPMQVQGIAIEPKTEVAAKQIFFEKIWGALYGNRWFSRSKKIVIEFLLPRTLFGWSVDRWKHDGIPIGHSYPIVLRWKDRKQNPVYQGNWLNWYQKFSNSVVDVQFHSTEKLTDQILEKVQCLEFAPARDRSAAKKDAITQLMDLGVSIAAWPRSQPNDWSRAEVSKVLTSSLSKQLGTVLELPKLRHTMKIQKTEAALAVFYDTPDQFFAS